MEERSSLTTDQLTAELADAGYAVPHRSDRYGGRGLSMADSQAILRVLGRKGVIGPPTGNAPNMGVPTILTHGRHWKIVE